MEQLYNFRRDAAHVRQVGILQEEVFMTQPPRFVDPALPSYVCSLHKSLYGLKQAPHAWYNRLSEFLLSIGF